MDNCILHNFISIERAFDKVSASLKKQRKISSKHDLLLRGVGVCILVLEVRVLALSAKVQKLEKDVDELKKKGA